MRWPIIANLLIRSGCFAALNNTWVPSKFSPPVFHYFLFLSFRQYPPWPHRWYLSFLCCPTWVPVQPTPAIALYRGLLYVVVSKVAPDENLLGMPRCPLGFFPMGFNPRPNSLHRLPIQGRSWSTATTAAAPPSRPALPGRYGEASRSTIPLPQSAAAKEVWREVNSDHPRGEARLFLRFSLEASGVVIWCGQQPIERSGASLLLRFV